MKLVIAEKPMLARDASEELGQNNILNHVLDKGER